MTTDDGMVVQPWCLLCRVPRGAVVGGWLFVAVVASVAPVVAVQSFDDEMRAGTAVRERA